GQNHAGNSSGGPAHTSGGSRPRAKAELTLGRKRKLEEKEKEVEEIEVAHQTAFQPAQRSRPAATIPVKRPEQRRASSEPPLSKIKRQRVQHASSQATCFFDPPINTRSLRELELPEILRNGKLRHDCVYDRLLHFR